METEKRNNKSEEKSRNEKDTKLIVQLCGNDHLLCGSGPRPEVRFDMVKNLFEAYFFIFKRPFQFAIHLHFS